MPLFSLIINAIYFREWLTVPYVQFTVVVCITVTVSLSVYVERLYNCLNDSHDGRGLLPLVGNMYD